MFLVKFEFVIFESTFVKIASATGVLLPTIEALFFDIIKFLNAFRYKPIAFRSVVVLFFFL